MKKWVIIITSIIVFVGVSTMLLNYSNQKVKINTSLKKKLSYITEIGNQINFLRANKIMIPDKKTIARYNVISNINASMLE